MKSKYQVISLCYSSYLWTLSLCPLYIESEVRSGFKTFLANSMTDSKQTLPVMWIRGALGTETTTHVYEPKGSIISLMDTTLWYRHSNTLQESSTGCQGKCHSIS
ncbi:hypothetical protein GDO78_011875 [Eleutherodactylus coqui]|uniref:Uncharacterized protein n=1 Tax=Eleutherodactylus coqui TaxID=57060 RepID=A0A8J6F4N7_ELECQ|nr:hypothetical protein GDO78_011875 [Eleutherodactylus coqui]